ncbi:MAG: amidohydrolase [Lentimicrobium sp.]|jgi:amidohydrolase|nr:amidohydrolase [Lentimicrobium sp.]MDD2527375.1 amidohydrolase [Lentimicrobiaceae bacterium]MDD4598616.1 amidohydrolase [Lentimicrobiaceae bacterium]MDY0025264.1 amidohydrolase [Lentimicrobium sp.]
MDWQKLERELISLRHQLHREPELSGNEVKTAHKIEAFARKYTPDQLITGLGGHGIAAIYNGKKPGPGVLIRCDMDALPIQEINEDLEYRSTTAGLAHKCGHDGHMAIAAGLLPLLAENKPEKGRVVILFQPAEETGQGAEKVIKDPEFDQIKPDFCFALHNLPGFASGSIIIGKNTFASASVGLIVKLNGRTAHAAEPEKAITPAPAIAALIGHLPELANPGEIRDFSLLTIIHARIGERAFGTTPGYAELMATLRAYTNDQLEALCIKVTAVIEEVAKTNHLKTGLQWVEAFPATVNNDECNQQVISAAKSLIYPVEHLALPFRWSEDFGHFTHNFKGALFGLGSGTNQPELHHPAYNFPDKIILNGTKIFHQIIKQLNG